MNRIFRLAKYEKSYHSSVMRGESDYLSFYYNLSSDIGTTPRSSAEDFLFYHLWTWKWLFSWYAYELHHDKTCLRQNLSSG